MSDGRPDFAGVGPIRQGHGIDCQALADWLQAHVPQFVAPLEVQQFKGGQSNPTYRLRTPSTDYVLRRKPPGPILKGAHAVEREFRVLSALVAAGFPVARPLALCTDEAVIGTPFFVMQMVEGRIFWEPALPSLSAPERTACFDAMNATLTRLHNLAPTEIGLADYGRPDNYLARQVARWSGQYSDDAEAGRLAEMDALAEWLPANLPVEQESRIVHGDFRADNLVFDASEPKVLAVLDWELSTLGDPLADFTYHLMMYRLPRHILGGLVGTDLVANGIPAEDEYLAAYCRRTGRQGVAALDFYLAFNMFRFSAIIHGIKGRLTRGNAASPHAASLIQVLPELAALACKQVGLKP